MPSANRSALLALALAVMVLVWAYSWIVMKQMLRYVGPFDFVALRYFGGSLVLLAALALRGESLRPPPLRLTLATGLFQTTGFQALAQWALVTGGAGRVSLLSYTMPFWAVLLAWWVLRERPSRRQWLGVALAAAGLLAVVEPWQGLGGMHSTVLAILGGASWATGTVLSKRMFELHAPSPLAFTAWQMLLGSLLLAAIALVVPSRPIEWAPAFIAGLAYCVLLASSLAWVLWLFVLKSLPTTVASLSSLAVPVTAILMAWALLDERPDAAETIGIALILLGLWAVSGGARKHGRAPT